MIRFYRCIMPSFWKRSDTSPTSEQDISPETLVTTETGVEPDSESSSENPTSEDPMSLHINSITTSDSSSYNSEVSTSTDGPGTLASTSVTEQTASNTSTAPPPAQDGSPHARLGQDIDCVDFVNSCVDSPTINIDSDDATGATRNTPDDIFQPLRPPSTMTYHHQITHARSRERSTCFNGTVANSPTINIRSARASGTIDTVVPSRTQAY
ncbi:hypothetical protein BDR07DRAFT_1610103 [Suillus spraguei]|nr:hypothetical protein BDR07DRAFT_1610103 [Suillus spraguei]